MQRLLPLLLITCLGLSGCGSMLASMESNTIVDEPTERTLEVARHSERGAILEKWTGDLHADGQTIDLADGHHRGRQP